MNRSDYVLAVLAAGQGAVHRPVQVQKLFFLLDKEIYSLVGGPYFSFEPYHYGPFDKQVYQAIQALADEGLADIVADKTWQSYRLTPLGQVNGQELLNQLQPAARDYIVKVSEFVRHASFTQLVKAIYQAYPDMRANSVFQG